MQRVLLVGGIICGILLLVATSRGADEPATADAAWPLPSPVTTSEPPGTPLPRDPHAPYDIGPANTVWQYEDLTPAEQEVADRGADPTPWAGAQQVYANAASELGRRAANEMAARMLGLDSTGEIGVVP